MPYKLTTNWSVTTYRWLAGHYSCLSFSPAPSLPCSDSQTTEHITERSLKPPSLYIIAEGPGQDQVPISNPLSWISYLGSRYVSVYQYQAGLTSEDKLLITTLGYLAQKRLARGLRLNRPEAVALIAFQLHEFIRDGRHSVAELMDLGKKFLGRRHVMGELYKSNLERDLTADGVAEGIHDVQVEGTFPVSFEIRGKDTQLICRMGEPIRLDMQTRADPIRTFLVSVHDPICSDSGDRTSISICSLLMISLKRPIRLLLTYADGGDVPYPRNKKGLSSWCCHLQKGEDQVQCRTKTMGSRGQECRRQAYSGTSNSSQSKNVTHK